MLHDLYVTTSFWVELFFIVYFSSINLIYAILLSYGSVAIYFRVKELGVEDFKYILRSDSLPQLTIIVPIFNESKTVYAVVSNLLNLTYRAKKIMVVNDGSTDNSLKILKEKFQLVKIPIFSPHTLQTKPIRDLYRSVSNPDLFVLDKENGEKHDALNAGINQCTTSFFITVDGDTCIDNEGFEALIRPLLSSPETVAIGASVRILNGCQLKFNRIITDRFPVNYITAMQGLEYLRAFLMRKGWDYFGGNYILAGAFSVFSTDVVKKIKGFGPTCANDLEIILRLNRILITVKTPYKISYVPDPIAWTAAPPDFKSLGHQRMLWHRGLLESLWFNRILLFNPKYGKYGMLIAPFALLGEGIEPLVEILGWIYIVLGLYLGVIDYNFIFLLMLIVFGFNFLYTLFCLFVEELSYNKFPKSRSILLLIFLNFL